ncbi:MAG: hypothetical protein QXG98_05760 [Candidatus Micrarchaeia archaeon]
MILGGKISYAKASRGDGRPRSVKVTIELTDVSARGDGLVVGFAYLADYGVGTLRMHGTLFTREESAERAAMLSAAFREKKFPVDVFRELIDAVNRLCSAEGAFLVVPLELAPPMKPWSVRGMCKMHAS